VQVCQVGARFEALDKLVFRAPKDIISICFTILTLLVELCVPKVYILRNSFFIKLLFMFSAFEVSFKLFSRQNVIGISAD